MFGRTIISVFIFDDSAAFQPFPGTAYVPLAVGCVWLLWSGNSISSASIMYTPTVRAWEEWYFSISIRPAAGA